MRLKRLGGGLWWQLAALVAVVVIVGGLIVAHGQRGMSADEVNCSEYKCVALTFDDGPSPFTDRLPQVLRDQGAKKRPSSSSATRSPPTPTRHGVSRKRAWRWLAIPGDIPSQLRKATQSIAAATGRAPNLCRPAGGLSNDAVRAEAGKQGLAEILWDVIPFDWINDSDLAASTCMLKKQITPGLVVLLHDTYSSTVDLVYQFLPVLIANGDRMVTVSHLLGDRAPGSTYGGRETGPPANALVDISRGPDPDSARHPSPKPAPNLPITDIAFQNPGGPPTKLDGGLAGWQFIGPAVFLPRAN